MNINGKRTYLDRGYRPHTEGKLIRSKGRAYIEVKVKKPSKAQPRGPKGVFFKLHNPVPRKPIYGYYKGDTQYFESVSAAEAYIGSRHISDVLKGKRNHVKGWTFAYAEGGDADVNSSIKQAKRETDLVS